MRGSSAESGAGWALSCGSSASIPTPSRRAPDGRASRPCSPRPPRGMAAAWAGDVTHGEDCRRMVSAAIERYGALDILHNNVGIESRKDLLETSEEEWDRVMAVDLKSMLLATQAAAVPMIQRGGGAIICVSSVAAMRGHGRTAYAAAKAGVIGFVRSVAAQLGAPRYRGHGLGRGLGRGLSGQRRGPLGHGADARGGRRPHADDEMIYGRRRQARASAPRFTPLARL